MFKLHLQTLIRNEKLKIDFSNQGILKQFKKIKEEYQEVKNEIFSHVRIDYHKLAAELLDLIQAAYQMLYILHIKGKINLEIEEKAHIEKLKSRDWEFEKPAPGTYIQKFIVTDVAFDEESQKYKFKHDNVELEWSKKKFESQFKPYWGESL